MGKRPIVTFLLELASAALVMYSTQRPDTDIRAPLWYIVWRSAQSIARTAGTIAMRAELRYFKVVQP